MGFKPEANPLTHGSNVFITNSELTSYGIEKNDLLKKIKNVWNGFDVSGY